MNIPISILLCLLLTALTGTVALVFWVIVGLLDRKKLALKAHYCLLKTVLLLFMVPVCFCLELLYRYEEGTWINTIFSGTLVMNRVADVLLVLWIAGMVIRVIKSYEQIVSHRLYIKTYQKTDRYDTILIKTKQCLRIKRKISIKEGEYDTSPFITGVFTPAICISGEDISQKSLEYMLLHELIHYRHRDVLWLCILRVLSVVYWFHPAFWKEKLVAWYRELMEDVCDIDVCRQVADYNDYIKVLLNTAVQTMEPPKPAPVFLSESCKDIIRRRDNMNRYQQQKLAKRLLIAIFVIALFCGSTGAVYAAEQSVVIGYRTVYDATTRGHEEEMNGNTENTLTEYYEPAVEDPNIAVEYVTEEVDTFSTLYSIDYTLSAYSEKRKTTGHTLSAGDKILVSVSMNPEDQNVKVGFRMSTGEVRYIVGSENIYHTFTIYDNATYYFFVQNDNATAVEVVGHYSIK